MAIGNKAKKTKKSVKKKTVSKSAVAKLTGKKTAAKKKVAKPSTKALPKASNPYTKTELFTVLAERTDLTKKDVAAVFSELTNVIEAHMKKGAVGKFTMPGLVKLTVKKVAAKKARKGANPFTGEPTIFKAKPASRKVKATPLKALKDLAD